MVLGSDRNNALGDFYNNCLGACVVNGHRQVLHSGFFGNILYCYVTFVFHELFCLPIVVPRTNRETGGELL